METRQFAVALGSVVVAAPIVLMLFLKLTTTWVETPTEWFRQYGGLIRLLSPLGLGAATVLLFAGILTVKRARRRSDPPESDR